MRSAGNAGAAATKEAATPATATDGSQTTGTGSQDGTRLVPLDLATQLVARVAGVDPFAAAELAPYVRVMFGRLLRNGGYVSPRMRVALEALEAAEAAAVALEQAAVKPHETAEVSSLPSRGFVGRPSGGQLTAAQVAALAGVSVQAVTKAARRQRLGARMTGGRWLIPESAARVWVAGREDSGRATHPTAAGADPGRRHGHGLPDHGHEAPGDHLDQPRP